MEREGVAREVRFEVRRSSLYASSVIDLPRVKGDARRGARQSCRGRGIGRRGTNGRTRRESTGPCCTRSFAQRQLPRLLTNQRTSCICTMKRPTSDRNVLRPRSSLRRTPHHLVRRVQPLEDKVVAIPPQGIVNGPRIVGRSAFEPVRDGSVGWVPRLSAGEGQVDDTCAHTRQYHTRDEARETDRGSSACQCTLHRLGRVVRA